MATPQEEEYWKRIMLESMNRGQDAFIPAQTPEQMVDISTPATPFSRPAQMMPPPPEETTVASGNPFEKEFYGSQPAPAQQYSNPDPVGGMGLLGVQPQQMPYILSQSGAERMRNQANVPSREQVSMIPTQTPTTESRVPKSVFGEDLIGQVAAMTSPLAEKVMSKKGLNSDQSLQYGAVNPMQSGQAFPQSPNGSQEAPVVQPQYTDNQAAQAQALRSLRDGGGDNQVIQDTVVDAAGNVQTDPTSQDSSLADIGSSPLLDKGNAEEFKKQLQAEEKKEPGFIQKMMADPNFFPQMAIAFNTLRLRPDQGLNTAMQKQIDWNNSLGKANRTADWFLKQGTPEGKSAYEFIKAGGSAKEAMEIFMPRYSMNPRVVMDKDGNRKLMTVSNKGVPKIIDIPGGYEPEADIKYIDAGTYTSLRHMGTGAEIGRIDKNLSKTAEETAVGKATGEYTAEQRLEAPKSYATAARNFGVITDLLQHPSFEDVFGAVEGRIPTLRQGTLDAEQYLKQIKGATFLAAYETLKGGGQITEVEGIKAEQAMARLATAQSEGAAEQALYELADILLGSMVRAKEQNPDALSGVEIPTLPERRYGSGTDLDGRSPRRDKIIKFTDL